MVQQLRNPLVKTREGRIPRHRHRHARFLARILARSWVEQGLTSHQTHYRSYRGRVLWVKRPSQQCQSTEGREKIASVGRSDVGVSGESVSVSMSVSWNAALNTLVSVAKDDYRINERRTRYRPILSYTGSANMYNTKLQGCKTENTANGCKFYLRHF